MGWFKRGKGPGKKGKPLLKVVSGGKPPEKYMSVKKRQVITRQLDELIGRADREHLIDVLGWTDVSHLVFKGVGTAQLVKIVYGFEATIDSRYLHFKGIGVYDARRIIGRYKINGFTKLFHQVPIEVTGNPNKWKKISDVIRDEWPLDEIIRFGKSLKERGPQGPGPDNPKAA